jgi:hypothetical protein
MGLYDDDLAAVTSGDISNKEYWYAKYASQKVDNALKTRQPEGAIKDYLPEAIKAYDAALATYPNHEDLKKWKEKAVSIQGKINPNAEWARFKSDFHWDNGPFEHGWVEFNWAKLAAQNGEWDVVYEQARSAHNHLGEYGAQKDMRAWSDDVKKWVTDSDTEAQNIWEESRKHR